MKKIIFMLVVSLPFFVKAQDIAVKRQIGIDATILGVGAFFEQPLSTNILAEVSAGVGSSVLKTSGSINYVSNDFRPYTRIELKRFYNRDNRVSKNKNILFNKGNYIGFQNKLYYGIKADEGTHTVMINELHWGVQAELHNRLLLNFHIGLGYASTKYSLYSSFLPTIGLKIKYVIFK
ncbi:hypothetical protein [Capnocytophaga cynodegmi]|uniref:DUF3575 domain-containing protein n=1 Tax=Capnocytophaga cynodegmi TaxID=28189 RepID=A0A0B7HJ70_9FLAO|nr:hypothetical protein [Capnocytophaga cynodegmi]CEN39756.1 conserved exported hypothetical protein [Capnocytophaga cynodegmi]